MRHAMKAFGLSLVAALSLMAVTAGAAHAELEFLKGEKTFLELGIEEENILGTVGEGELLTAAGVKIWCSGGAVTGTIYPHGKGEAQILYKECKVLEQPSCHIYENLMDAELDENRGFIKATGTGLVIKHTDNKEYLLLEGLGTEKIFTTFTIWNLGLCLITFEEFEHVTVTGSAVVALPDALKHQVAHKIETINPLTELFKDQLFLQGEKAHLAAGTTGSIHLEDGKSTWGVTAL